MSPINPNNTSPNIQRMKPCARKGDTWKGEKEIMEGRYKFRKTRIE